MLAADVQLIMMAAVSSGADILAAVGAVRPIAVAILQQQFTF